MGLHCQTDESLSGKYLTDLPGVSLQNIDAAANAEQGSFIGVFADVEKRAMSRITKDILVHLKSQYNLKKSVAYRFDSPEVSICVPNSGHSATSGTPLPFKFNDYLDRQRVVAVCRSS